MLTLSRKLGQVVELQLPDGSTASVEVREINRHAVRLSFDAPPDVKIFRRELLERAEK